MGTPNNKIICAIDGIDPNSFDLKPSLTGTYSLTFDINKYLTFQIPKNIIVGTDAVVSDEANNNITDEVHNLVTTPKTVTRYKMQTIRSNSYVLAGILMRVYVENVGWFTMQAPEEHDDGDKAYKTINATSIEIELQQHDLKNFKINQGTTDSYEMLADNNVNKIGDVEFAKEQIKFCNKKNRQLSLIDLALKTSGATGWSVGYIDTVPETYRNFEDGEYVETQKLLSDEIGAFDIESENLYTFLVQDVAKYFNCICVFDIRNLKINFYHPDNLGKDTGINISFRNLKQSHDISVDEDSIFTRYYVNGDEELGITYVNFGSNYIEDLHYFMNEKYMSASLIEKYKLWLGDVESYRLKYITATRNYNKQMSVITELYDRQPIDDCSTDWSTFSDDDLIEAKANYEAQQKGYEQFYVDENGDFDEEALKNSVDADTYYQIRDVIIPSIKIEFENRELPTDADKKDYIDTYKTDWKLYGLDELQVKLNGYKDVIKTCKAGGYDVPYSINSSKTKEVHEKMYAKYLDALNQLDGSYVGGCQEAYNQRKAEIDAATVLRDEYDKARTEAMDAVDKEKWKHNSNGKTYSFTADDLAELSKLYIDGDYTNENMFLTSSDDQVSAIDEQLKLLKAAQDDLYSMSQPQYTYTTSLDNFISQYQYKNYTNNLNLGDYIHLEVDDDYVVKLRVISYDYNPLRMDEKLTLEFSSMVQSRNKRSDLSFLLSNTPGGSKNSSSGSSNNFLNNEGITLTSGLIQKLLSSGAFSNKVGQIINNNYAGILGGGSISLEELNVKMMNVVDIKGQNAFFEYISSKLIETDKIVADSGEFKELKAFAATIKQAIIGSSSTETGIVINLTAENATISEALIKSLISQYITVGDLKAGNIITDNINVMSQDGKLQIVGNTFTIYDGNNNPVIQLGQDKNGNYGLVISDSKGAILLDSEGLHEGIVPDNFIKTHMIGDGQITEDKIDKTNIRNWKDENGNNVFDVSKLYYGNDKFEVSYSSMKESVQTTKDNLDQLQQTVDYLGNGYSIVLSNESQNIPCTATGITSVEFKIEIPFKGYEGIKQAACTVEITNLPTGITLASNKPSTATEDGLVVLNVQKDSNLGGNMTGSIIFTGKVADRTIVKKFSWLKSLAGQQGSQGVPGENATTHYTWIKYADSPTSGMSDEPEGKSYIGFAYNKTSPNESSNYSDYAWSLVKGEKGDKGIDGKTPVKGVDYFDGTSAYLWIRYSANSDGSGMTTIPTSNTKYIGTASTTSNTAPTAAGSYVWSKYVGENGTPGENGYVHIAYADSADGTVGFNTTVGTNKKYIGQYTDHNAKDSTNPSDYSWTLIKGDKGDKGEDGDSLYTWIKYADDINGTNMSDDSTGKYYIGLAYNKTTQTESTNPKDYTWSLFRGAKGVRGEKGADGKIYYTWFKYADDDHGTNMSKDPAGKKYIGIAYNKETLTESNNASDYTWSLFRGADGIKGEKGETGESLFTWIKYSNDATGSNMTDNPDGKKYIGIAYNKTTSTESTNPKDYTWSLIQGADGNDAVFYYLTPSVDVIKKETLISQCITDEAGNHIVSEDNTHISELGYDDTLTPSSIIFEAHKIVGNNTPVSYACRFVIQESVNGVSYVTKYSSVKDETSVTYTPSTTNLYGLKCILYAPGGITTQLDSQTISVISDSSAVTPAIKAFQQQFKTIDFTVNQMDKEIKAKATQKDIEDSINEYDGTTTQKVRDQLTEQTVKIAEISSKVSDVQTEIIKKADGSTVTELTNRVSKAEQDATGFRQTVEKDYAKTNDVSKAIKSSVDQSAESIKTEVKNTYGTKEDVSRIEQKTDSVTTEVQNARGDEASLNVRINGIESTIKDANGNITQLRTDINGVSTEVADARGNKATLKERVDGIDASVKTAEGEISQLKIDKENISTTVNKHNERISNVEQTANGLTSTVKNLKVGSENLIRNSNNLIFNMYNFVALLSDEAANRIIDENGNNLIAYY